MMRRMMVAGNWKMNGSQQIVEGLVSALKRNFAHMPAMVEAVVFPPFVYLMSVAQMLTDSQISLGAQNVDYHEEGAYTGEVAASMLRDCQCRYVLVGHSERRQFYHEDNAVVAKKFFAAQQHNVTPILCVGETLEQRQQNMTFDVIDQQLDVILQGPEGCRALQNAIIAYEPVWAIGTGVTAEPSQAQEVHYHIRQRIAAIDSNIANGLCILYGGSVKASNAATLFAMPDIDGGLVGGASLDAQEFQNIVFCAAETLRNF